VTPNRAGLKPKIISFQYVNDYLGESPILVIEGADIGSQA